MVMDRRKRECSRVGRCGGRLAVCALVFVFLALSEAACIPNDLPQRAVTLNRGNGPDIKSLDPAFIEGSWEIFVVGDMLMGLTTEGPDGKPVPGAATRWETSPDGLTWTFHMRDHVWSDGVPVTAADFVTAWRRELDPRTAAPYAYNLWVLKNAHAISEGKLPPQALGVHALDDKTLVVTLEHPAAYLPELLDHEAAYPIPRHVYEKLGDAWSRPQNYVANGPYIVKRWIPLDHVTLVKNKRFYDADHVQIDVVNYYVTMDSEAGLKRYRAGELDTLYQFPVIEIEWMRAHIAPEIKSTSFLGINYLVPNFDRPEFRDGRLREVLNLVLNRRKLVRDIRHISEAPAYSYVPPGVANYPHTAAASLKAVSYEARIEKAKEMMRAMGYGPAHRLRINFLSSTNPDILRNAATMQSMFSAVWIDLNIVAEERQVQLVDLQEHNFDLASSAWAADFNDATNFLDLLSTGSGENYGSYANPAYDALLGKAQNEADPKLRGELLAKAEQMAINDDAWVPMYFSVTTNLAKPYVKGWIPNATDVNRTRWLRIEGKPGSL